MPYESALLARPRRLGRWLIRGGYPTFFVVVFAHLVPLLGSNGRLGVVGAGGEVLGDAVAGLQAGGRSVDGHAVVVVAHVARAVVRVGVVVVLGGLGGKRLLGALGHVHGGIHGSEGGGRGARGVGRVRGVRMVVRGLLQSREIGRDAVGQVRAVVGFQVGARGLERSRHVAGCYSALSTPGFWR